MTQGWRIVVDGAHAVVVAAVAVAFEIERARLERLRRPRAEQSTEGRRSLGGLGAGGFLGRGVRRRDDVRGGRRGALTAGLHRDGEGSFARCARAN